MILPILVLAGLEIGLRILGYSPYKSSDFKVSSEPGLWIVPDDSLGFFLNEGAFEVTVNEKLVFPTLHGSLGNRVLGNEGADYPFLIDFHGGSFAYGWGLPADESMAYLVQDEFSNALIRNFSTPGYGLVQSLLILQKQQKNGDLPSMAILNYMPFHDERNSMNKSYQEKILQGYRNSNEQVSKEFGSAIFPYIRNGQIAFKDWSSATSSFSLRDYSALVNLIASESALRADKQIDARAETIALLKKVSALCEENGVRLLVYVMSNEESGKSAFDDFSKLGIDCLLSPIDLQENKWTLYPLDSHPNEKANRELANTLTEKLDQTLYE